MRFNLVLATLIIFTSCQGNTSNEPEIKNTDNDTVFQNIPQRYFIHGVYSRLNRIIEKEFNLYSLTTGFDSLEIRISFACKYDYEKHGMIILQRNKALDWGATFYEFDLAYQSYDNYKVQNTRIEKRQPKSGWSFFMEKLYNTGILDLPDFESIFNYGNIDDSEVTVEISARKKYRIYSYPGFESNLNMKVGPANLHEAINLIESEFNYQRPCKNTSANQRDKIN